MTPDAPAVISTPRRSNSPDRSRRDVTMEQAVATHIAAGRRITSVDCWPSPYRSSCAVDDVDVRFDDGSSVELVAKAVDWRAMCADAHRARPRWLWVEGRERAMYEFLLSTSDVRAARYFGSYVNRSGLRYLLLERIAGTPLWQHGDFETWREAACWLAHMHVRVRLEAVFTSRVAPLLLRYDRPFYDSWMHRARAFHAGSRAVRALSEPHRRVVDWLLCESTTFLHGEFYPSNIVVERNGRRSDRIRPVDWEMAALGPASIDLAYLLSGQWTDAERANAADAYYLERAALGCSVPAREHYLRTLDYCLIHLSVRNLGWSPDWVPPAERAHDWLGEASRLCEKWEL